MQDFGLVSVIMPAYNAERYIKTAIESVLSQTYKNLELIIVNDGSTDGTENIIKSFSDSRIVYIKHESNLGVAEARNSAFKVAKGKFGALIDADDAWLPERLEKMLDVLTDLGSESYFIEDDHIMCFDFNGRLKKWDSQLKLFYKPIFQGNFAEVNLTKLIEIGAPMMHPIFPLQLVKEKGIIQNQNFVPGEDLAFYFELLLSGLKLIILKEAYYLYRITPGSLTHKKPKNNIPAIFEYLSSKYELSHDEKDAFKKLIAISEINTRYDTFTYYLKSRNFISAISYFLKNPNVFLMLLLRLPYSLRYRFKNLLITKFSRA
ncbi:MAG: glycosyltransferase family 2 protein [Nitrososphaeria archaeon]